MSASRTGSARGNVGAANAGGTTSGVSVLTGGGGAEGRQRAASPATMGTALAGAAPAGATALARLEANSAAATAGALYGTAVPGSMQVGSVVSGAHNCSAVREIHSGRPAALHGVIPASALPS